MFASEKYRDLETRVRKHSRSLEKTTFDRFHDIGLYDFIFTFCSNLGAINCTVSEIYRDIAANSQL